MKKNLIITLALAGFAFGSPAASLLSDDFNYADGAIVSAPGTPWVPTSGSGSMIVTNNQLEVNANRGEDIAAPLSGGPYMTNGPIPAVYAKFTVRFSSPPSGTPTYFAHFTGENISSDFRARVGATWTNVTTTVIAAPGNFFLGIANNSGTVGLSIPFPTELTTNVTYTVVTKYELATGLSTLWIDPTDETSTHVTATLSPSMANPKHFGFRQANNEGIMRVDNLRVATSFAEIAGANTSPTIGTIANHAIPRGGNTGLLPFKVGDAESDPSILTVAPASTNLTLVPLSGIVINNGDGTNRTVTVTGAAGEQGRTLITLTVSDGTNSSASSFLLTVGAPIISTIGNQIATANTVIPPIDFTVTDAEGDTLTPTVSSSNTNLLKSANITINGTGSSRTLTLVPEANTNGVTTVTLSFSDGFNTTTRTFSLTLRPLLGMLLQDQFTYTSFTLANAIYGATGSPWQTVSGTAYEVQSTNGWAYLTAALGEDVGAPLTNSAGIFPGFTNYPASDGVVFYSSFTLKVTELPAGEGDYFAHLKNSYNGTTFRAKVFVSTNGAAAGSYRIGVANQATAGIYYPLDCSLNTDYLIVTRYNSPIGETALWVNPIAESVSYVIGTDALQTSSIGGYGLRQSSGIGSLQISNLVVSTSFPTLPVIPESGPIKITDISVSGGTVTINFEADASDSPAGFDVISAGTVNGTYTPAPATITNPSAGKFQAKVAGAGSAQFYRIKRK